MIEKIFWMFIGGIIGWGIKHYLENKCPKCTAYLSDPSKNATRPLCRDCIKL